MTENRLERLKEIVKNIEERMDAKVKTAERLEIYQRQTTVANNFVYTFASVTTSMLDATKEFNKMVRELTQIDITRGVEGDVK